MKTIRSALKKAHHTLLRYAWYLGGQKEHQQSGLAVPRGGFVSEGAALVFPQSIRLGENVQLLAGARLICTGMPPYLKAAGKIEIGEDRHRLLHEWQGEVSAARVHLEQWDQGNL